MRPRITYYHILGVSSDAAEDEIIAAFRMKVKQWHPDVSSHPDAEERMREINKAAEVLCDPERRKRYDRALAGITPFESGTVPKKARNEPGDPKRGSTREDRKQSAEPPLFGNGSIRSVMIGCAALCILCLLAGAVLLAVPAVTGPGTATAGIAVMETTTPAVAAPGLLLTRDAGDTYLSAGDYAGAIAAYDAVIAGNPGITDREFWYNRGTAQNALGQYSEAAESFDHVLRIAPRDPLALAQMGAALIGLGRYEESLLYTDMALSGNPDLAWIWNNRGVALEYTGQLSEARLAYENAGILPGAIDITVYKNIVAGRPSATGF